MVELIVEVLAETVASVVSETLGKKINQRLGKWAGWVTMAVLVAIIALCVWLGIYIIQTGESVAIGVLMFAIAAFILGLSVLFVVRGLQKRKKS